MPDLALTFRKPFAEQLAALRIRLSNLIPTERWTDVWHSAHDRGFMVAGAAKADLLADLAGAVDKAVSQGTTLDQFRNDFREVVARHGWTGWTGEGSQKGEAWRTKVIYQTNMRTSFMSGRHAQLLAGNYKWWVYRHSGAEHPRLHHLALDGIALPPDHPFWKTHFPPNGWGCGCEVYGAHTLAGIRRVGGDPNKQLPPGWDRRGQDGNLPAISKGWDYAPGATVADTIRELAPKLDRLPPQPSIDLIQSWVRSSIFEGWMANPRENFPLLRISQDDADLLGAKSLIASLSPETMAKQLREHPELTAFDYAEAQRVASDPTRRIVDSASSLIYTSEPEGANGYVLVVKATQTRLGLFVTSFRRLSMNAVKRDQALRRLLKKGK
ncbi:phage head morphogenesis protein [Paracoccus denitrificans]|uniref:phage head morphogenesis protein n=1 Tax=Paracoccus denitrificans TaxID=266 RepID=UPI003364B517